MFACVLLCVGIDQYLLEDVYHGLIFPLAGDWIPLPFLQVILLPAVLLAAARIFGGSKPILIEKAPRPSQRKK